MTWNVAGVKLTTQVLDEVAKMSWFKLRRDDNVAGRDLRIEAVRMKRDEHAENGWHPGE